MADNITNKLNERLAARAWEADRGEHWMADRANGPERRTGQLDLFDSSVISLQTPSYDVPVTKLADNVQYQAERQFHGKYVDRPVVTQVQRDAARATAGSVVSRDVGTQQQLRLAQTASRDTALER